MENWIARLIALTVSLIGVAFIAVFPLTRTALARERVDLERAGAPLLSVPLENLAGSVEHAFDVTIPNDQQWRRIADRLGAPVFLLVAASARGETRAHRFPPADIGLSSRVSRNGAAVALVATDDIPDGYSTGATTGGYKFPASPGDAVRIRASIRAATVPPGTLLLVVPQWSTSSASAWAEGADFAVAVRLALSMASVLVGALLIWWAATIAWGRPSSAA